MFLQHVDWDLTHQVLFTFCPAIIWTWLEIPGLKMHILWCRTDICSCKLSEKVSLMLDNPFPVPSLCKLNHISICFIQISMKVTCKQLIPFRESHVFSFYKWSRCFGPLGKFQHSIEISIKTAHISRLSISSDYVLTEGFPWLFS